MCTTMTAIQVSEAWIGYVTETFVLQNGSVRPEVEEEYKRLEATDSFTQNRELWRSYTDTLIDRILESPPELRIQIYATTDHRSLAYVQDRIQCGTELLGAMAQKGLKIDIGESAALDGFFRELLLQRPEAA